ncbi:pilus assembly protein [Cognatishimia sp. WU-CL00825]|uniref:TadE/TadG family type IV pilus assembly protein n=1 Tax=Cognatishimia sp. WU-CL00825 TaxID=3127658 RepID=UPI00310A6ACA
MFNALKKLKSFTKDASGSVAIETVIILPLLFWAIAAVAIFFDAYRTKSAAEKAAFTISDMLSRETNAITPTYVTNTRSLFDALAKSDTDSSMRISVITWNEDEDAYEMEWSQTRGDTYAALTAQNLIDLKDSLPTMADQDAVILIETQTTFDPALDVGLGSRSIETFVFTRPRYAPQLVFSTS